MSRRNSDFSSHNYTNNAHHYQQSFGSSTHHGGYSGYTTSSTNADPEYRYSGTGSSWNQQRRHSEQLSGSGRDVGVGGRREGYSQQRSNLSTGTNTSPSYSGRTSSGSERRLGLSESYSAAGRPPPLGQAHGGVSVSQRGTRPATRPATGGRPGRETEREGLQSAESVEIGGGVKGEMRDVEDDTVLITVNSADKSGAAADLVRQPLGSGRRQEHTATSASTGGQEHHLPLQRQSSESYHSDEMGSGKGIVKQPESSKFEHEPEHDSKAKALPGGERSIDIKRYNHTLSKTSSASETSYERLLSNSTTSNTISCSGEEDTLSQLKEKYEEQVTRLTERLSMADEEREKVRKEKEKLERKLKEAETVAAQANSAAVEMSRLEAELKSEKESMMKLIRVRRCVSPEPGEGGGSSLQLSQELDLVRAKLEHEVLAREAIQQEMISLKQSLVVGEKGEFVESSTKLRERVAELEGTVHTLEQTLTEKESEAKRQSQVQSRAIADLESKLSRERQQREKLRQQVTQEGAASPRPTSSPEVAEMAKQLKEKETKIETMSQQMQKFEKTAWDVTKIIQHSRQQSETVAALKQELLLVQESVQKREAELKASQEELIGMRTQFENTIRLKNAELSKKGEEMTQWERETESLRKELTHLSAAVSMEEAKRSEVEQALQRCEKECNHWKQKSVQQDMVLQTKTQDVDRLHREVNDLRNTVSAQGKEVERLQKENQGLSGEIETHRLTAMTYKEDFESERKDREAVHTRIANMETQYRHQLEAMGEELRRAKEEARRQGESVGNVEEMLQQQRQQRQQMGALLQQKEEENKKLEEDVMSKTQQVKQYKKQIDQLSTEATLHKQQAAAHMAQIEFYAKKTEEYGRQKTFKELQERKVLELETQCDQLRAENNELRAKVRQMSLQSRTPLLTKSQTVQALPNRHSPQGHPMSPTALSHFNHSNLATAVPPNSHALLPHAPSSPSAAAAAHFVPAGSPHHISSSSPRPVGGYHQPPAPQLQRHDSPYSSLPSSGFGMFGPPNQRPADPMAAGTAYRPPGSQIVDKDSPPNSNVGMELHPISGYPHQQRKAHSQLLSMGPRPPAQQGHHHVYSNLPIMQAPAGTAGGGSRYLGMQQVPSAQSPTAQGRAIGAPQTQYATPTEETRRRRSQKPQLEGYVRPQQASSSPHAGQSLAVDPLLGSVKQPHNSATPPQNTGDISKGIDRDIEETVSKVREDEEMTEGEDGEGIPYDPNLVCPKCRMRFREGEIQKFRRHVSSAHK